MPIDPTLPPFNADPTGLLDSTAALDAAFSAAGASLDTIYLPAGTYRVLHLAPILTPLVIVGAGSGASMISTDQPTGDVLVFQHSGADLSRLGFTSSVQRTADSFVVFDTGANDSKLDDFYIHLSFIGIRISANAAVRLSRGTIRDTQPGIGSAGIVSTAGNDHYIDGVTFDADPLAMPASGIWVTGASGCLNISNCDVIHHGTDLRINAGFSTRVTACYFDTASRGVLIQPTVGAIGRVTITDCWVGSHTGNGILIAGGSAGVIGAIEIKGLQAYRCGANGVAVTAGVANLQIIGGFFGHNVGAGVYIAAGVSHAAVAWITAGATPGEPGNGTWGLYIDAGVGDYLRIAYNDLTGNALGGLSNGATGSHNVINNNL